jgi:hypothetical protein
MSIQPQLGWGWSRRLARPASSFRRDNNRQGHRTAALDPASATPIYTVALPDDEEPPEWACGLIASELGQTGCLNFDETKRRMPQVR